MSGSIRLELLDRAAIEHLATRIFSPFEAVAVERVEEGISTYVYRIRRGAEIFYLRVLPEKGASFAPEVYVHNNLRMRGVRVPEIIYFEHETPALRCSVMVTTAIEGEPLDRATDAQTLRRVLLDAGRDLAIINDLAVEGFGWIRRDNPSVTLLTAEMPTNRAFVLQDLDAHLGSLYEEGFLSRAWVEAIRIIVTRFDTYLDTERASLAHGDFDATHIYQHNGRYTGLIDFGEIRGADRFYDLGHSFMENRTLLPDLLDGYGEVAPLPPDTWKRIHFASLFIRIRRAMREARKHRRGVPNPATLACIEENINALLG